MPIHSDAMWEAADLIFFRGGRQTRDGWHQPIVLQNVCQKKMHENERNLNDERRKKLPVFSDLIHKI